MVKELVDLLILLDGAITKDTAKNPTSERGMVIHTDASKHRWAGVIYLDGVRQFCLGRQFSSGIVAIENSPLKEALAIYFTLVGLQKHMPSNVQSPIQLFSDSLTSIQALQK
eukprot:Filipodium_phascolosomae@DN1752_c0_g1_i1.p1